MTVTSPTNNNQPHHMLAATLLANIATQTTFVASLVNGSQGKNDAANKLAQMQREAVDQLMDYGILQPATILATCTYGT